MNLFRQYLFSSISVLQKSLRYNSNLNPLLNMAKSEAKRIVWVDLEMTGLDIDKDHILEIACLVTDGDLNVVATGPNIVVHQPDNILANMNSWCVAQHGESGLTEASRNSKVSIQDAEKKVLEFVRRHAPEKKCPMGGNSVYMDRLFIRKYMPKLDSYLHYRIIDVSTLKELAKRWYKKEYADLPQKKFRHRSIDDILESIQELKYYKETIFKSL
ncbi:probable oligoribonuclease isoform X1 [Galleria mellonella]|nr:probable oligoribonuclease isoform X1 [Galleria mellonella]